MTIKLEKILTIKIDSYYETCIKPPDNYEVKGVHLIVKAANAGSVQSLQTTNVLEQFAKLVPDNAEVVVDFIPPTDMGNNEIYIGGTALIPIVNK